MNGGKFVDELRNYRKMCNVNFLMLSYFTDKVFILDNMNITYLADFYSKLCQRQRDNNALNQ